MQVKTVVPHGAFRCGVVASLGRSATGKATLRSFCNGPGVARPFYGLPMRWTEDAPTHCPDGHELGPERVLVGWVAARAGTLEGGTRVHECRQCGAVIRWKPNSRWK